MSLERVINSLLEYVPVNMPPFPQISAQRTCIETMSNTVREEACLLGLEAELPQCFRGTKYTYLGGANLPGLILYDFNNIEDIGSFHPIGVGPWREQLIALRELAKANFSSNDSLRDRAGQSLRKDLTGQSANGGCNSPKRSRGRKPDPTIDASVDKRLCDDWKAAKGQGMSRVAFTREKGIDVNDLIAALDRQRYRRRRDEH